jgi:hypothetical protein
VQFFRDCVEALQRNLTVVLLYMAIVAPLGMLYTLTLDAFLESVFGLELDQTVRLLKAAAEVLIVAAYAAAQAIVFSVLGRDIDHPLWKLQGPGEALRRFFPLWFVIGLVALLAAHLGKLLDNSQATKPLAPMLFFIYVFIAVAAVPIGGCIMFHGKLVWAEFGETLRPLARQASRTGALVLLALLPFALYGLALTGYDVETKQVEQPVLLLMAQGGFHAFTAYIDCLVLAGTWIICVTGRQLVDDDDLGF